MTQEQTKATSPEDFTLYKSGYWTVAHNVAKSANGQHGSAIGAKEISRGVHQWLVLYESSKRCCGYIGICTTTTGSILTNIPTNTSGTVSLYHDAGNCVAYYNETGSSQKIKNELKPLRSGDKIRIILDITQKMVTFYHNTELAFVKKDLQTGDDNKYRLCVDGDGIGDKYTILESNTCFPNLSLQPLSSPLNKLSKELKAFDVKELKKLPLTDLAQLTQNTAKCMNECKEFEQNYDIFKNEVKLLSDMLYKEMNPDKNGFEQWKTEDICRYVLSLENQRFAKYFDEFRKAIEAQEIKGCDLVDITSNDLLTMGINVFRDRKDLAKYFQGLACNEGNVTETKKKQLYNCEFCEYSSDWKSNMSRHLRNVHKNIKSQIRPKKKQMQHRDINLKCGECGKICKTKPGLGIHKYQSHGIVGTSAASKRRKRNKNIKVKNPGISVNKKKRNTIAKNMDIVTIIDDESESDKEQFMDTDESEYHP